MDNSKLRVTDEATVVSFVRYLDDLPDGNGLSADLSAGDVDLVRCRCISQYEEIRFFSGYRQTRSAVVCMKSPDEVGTRSYRMLTFRIAGDSSTGDDRDLAISELGPVIYVILLRINPRLTGMPSLEVENAAVLLLRRLASDASVDFCVLRTLAKRELVVLAGSDDMRRCEILVSMLQRACAVKGGHAAAFPDVAVWPSVKWDQEKPEQFFTVNEEYPTDPDRDSTYGFTGLRVTGTCAREALEGSVCGWRLEDEIRGAFSDRRRPITGLASEHQICWPKNKSRNLYTDVSTLRALCQEKTCSIGLVRQVGSLSPKCYLLEDSEHLAHSEYYRTGKWREADRNIALEKLRGHAGWDLIAHDLESKRSKLRSLLLNPHVASEFRDLQDFFVKVAKICRMHEKLNERPNTTEIVRNRVRNRGINLSRHYDRALRERMRENVLVQPLTPQLSFLGASGFSRIAPAGRFGLNSLMRELGCDVQFSVAMGPRPESRLDSEMGTATSPLAAALEPVYHHALGHEGGHGFLDRCDEAVKRCFEDAVRERAEALMRENKPGDPYYEAGTKIRRFRLEPKIDEDTVSRQEKLKLLELLTEQFSDAICLKYTFMEDSDAYIDAWARHFARILENDRFVGTLEVLRGAVDETGRYVKPKAGEYANRMIQAVAYREYTARAANTGSKDPIDCLETAARKVASKVRSLADDKSFESSVLDALEDAAVDSEVFLQCLNKRREQPAVTAQTEKNREVITYEDQAVLTLATFEGMRALLEVVETRLDSEKVRTWSEGCIATAKRLEKGYLALKPHPLPLSVLAKLGFDDQFAKSMAALLSLAHWEELQDRQGDVPLGQTTSVSYAEDEIKG
ncbi:MAG: hypothetical protein IT365_24270 [Candidatus Hydrogenedentes bacterium]|nr:hypothetical protein [Candidatus Hydrogenedentota bacterium]